MSYIYNLNIQIMQVIKPYVANIAIEIYLSLLLQVFNYVF